MLYFILLPFYTLLFVGFVSCKKKIYIYIFQRHILTAKKKVCYTAKLEEKCRE